MKLVLPTDETDLGEQDRAGLFKLTTAVKAEKRGAVLPDANLPSDSDEEELEKPKEVSNKVSMSRYELKDGEDAMVEDDQSNLEELDLTRHTQVARNVTRTEHSFKNQNIGNDERSVWLEKKLLQEKGLGKNFGVLRRAVRTTEAVL
jgi:hypothetical protein